MNCQIAAFLLVVIVGKFGDATEMKLFFTASGGGKSFSSNLTLPSTSASLSVTTSQSRNNDVPSAESNNNNYFHNVFNQVTGSDNANYMNLLGDSIHVKLDSLQPQNSEGSTTPTEIPLTATSSTTESGEPPSITNITRLPPELDDEVQDFAYQAENAQTMESFVNEAATVNQDISVKSTTGVFVPSCADRSFWDSYSILPFFSQAAQYFQATPMPAWSDTAYLSYKKSGDRQTGQSMMWARRVRLPYLVIAECKYNNGTFVPTIESDLVALSKQRSWAFPSADPDLSYFYGTKYFSDLSSADIAENLGLAIYLLNHKISSSTKTVVKDALNTRVFNPIRKSFNGTASWQWWMTSQSNHNAVIWAGVSVAAFSVLDSADDRKFFASKAIYYSKNYLNSFNSDGYGFEGVGYWNYGFVNYALLRQTLYDGTDGTYDSFADSKASLAALFSKEFGMGPGNAANFGDCHFNVFFDAAIVKIVSMSFLQVSEASFQVPNRAEGLNLAYYLPKLLPQNTPFVSGVTTAGMNALRRFYNASGVLVVRPNSYADGKGLAATVKLGGNKGGHSHNDIGSYVISSNSNKLTGDVGGPLFYDEDTFGDQRYDSPLMNSYGHPVPVVNGRLQSDAATVLRNSAVKIKSKSFSNDADSILFELKGAYAEPYLKSLTRNFVYSRTSGVVTITDAVNFSMPCTFEDALISNKQWTFTSASSGYFRDGNDTLRVEVSSDAPFVMNATLLTSYKVTFTRVGIYLLNSVKAAKVTVKFIGDTPQASKTTEALVSTSSQSNPNVVGNKKGPPRLRVLSGK